MSPPVLFSAAARRDLDELWFEIALDSLANADRMIDRIGERCGQLSIFPESAPLRPDIAPNARCFVVGNYLILYHVMPEHVEVVRVVHDARDTTSLF
ncbi:type II toxin-antitoxin system RelE/ParE family toxin [Corticibacterium sp. UT-5YL-CI-8]|nr:type II toxin-antitoxin system RelE/ParE family toxin [Tianweitania sp. UT-5YL-CI-8]